MQILMAKVSNCTAVQIAISQCTGQVCALDYHNNRETKKPLAALSCLATSDHADVCLQAGWVWGCVHVASRNDRHPLSSGEAHEPHKAQLANRATPEGCGLTA